jgi:signal transduction histidine kinase/FixJ family two-component response regulator
MILIVDDKQENIFSLKMVLEQQGFPVDSALSGEEALKKLLKNEYALILLDVQMPGMDGFEVAEAVMGLNKTRDIPVIFLSAVNTHKKFVTKGFESGAVEYLTKPVDSDILILKVRNFYRLYEKTEALKQAEKSLKATVDELHTTLESLPQPAFTATPSGVLEYVNKRWLHYAPSMEEFPETDEGSSFKEIWLRRLAIGKRVETEVNIKNLDDGAFYCHLLKAEPVVINGSIKRWVGTLTDIHEQKMAHEVLEKKVAEKTRELMDVVRDLEISNTDLQQFTAVTSHDLKEPLRKIQFFGNLLRDKAELEEPLAKYLSKILRSSARMNELITDLLNFASVTKPNIFLPTDINTILRDILDDFELIIAEKNALVEIGEIPAVEAIPLLIKQLFHNIIGNALKFSRADIQPRISVQAELVDGVSSNGAAVQSGPYCRITITDNGIGFDEKYAGKIFTIFQRLNSTAEYEGTGMGLAIAKKIVGRHNGFIEVKSTPGAGSSFFVILPVKQDQAYKTREEVQFTATQLP